MAERITQETLEVAIQTPGMRVTQAVMETTVFKAGIARVTQSGIEVALPSTAVPVPTATEQTQAVMVG